jgi:hypothetical protein
MIITNILFIIAFIVYILNIVIAITNHNFTAFSGWICALIHLIVLAIIIININN